VEGRAGKGKRRGGKRGEKGRRRKRGG